jgi:hypothetical protein
MTLRDRIISVMAWSLTWLDALKAMMTKSSVLFMATFFFWGILILELFSGLTMESTSKYIPVALEPALVLLFGIILCACVTKALGRIPELVFFRTTLILGIILDYLSYEILTDHTPLLLVFMYAHIALSLTGLGFLQYGLVRLVLGLGVLALIVPWFFIPILPIFSFVSTH